MKKLLLFTLLTITPLINCSGSGYSLGNYYYYNDYDSGSSYTVTSIGNYDYVSGSNGYHGTGTKIGNYYYYND